MWTLPLYSLSVKSSLRNIYTISMLKHVILNNIGNLLKHGLSRMHVYITEVRKIHPRSRKYLTWKGVNQLKWHLIRHIPKCCMVVRVSN